MRQAETRHSTWPPGDPLQTRTLERVWQLWLERYIKNNFKNYYLSKSWSKDSNLNRSLLRVPNNRMDDLGQLLNASWHFINPLNSASVDCLWQPSYLVVAIGKLRKQISRSTRSFIHSFLTWNHIATGERTSTRSQVSWILVPSLYTVKHFPYVSLKALGLW